jgi:hypothetical protein
LRLLGSLYHFLLCILIEQDCLCNSEFLRVFNLVESVHYHLQDVFVGQEQSYDPPLISSY